MRKTVWRLLTVLGLFLLGACSTQQAETEDVFRVGMEANYAPFNWTQAQPGDNTAPIENGGGYAGGYDVAIAQKVADQLGKKLVVVKTDWDGLIPALQSGKIDAIIAGMSPTEERKQEIDFTDSYFDSELVMVVRRDGPYANAATVNDFSSARVTGQLGTLHYDLLAQLTGANIQEAMSDFSAMRVALESGKIDAYVAEKSTAMEVESATSTLKMIQFSSGNGFVVSPEDVSTSIGLIKGSDLTERINQILATISQEERDQLMEVAMQGESADTTQETTQDVFRVGMEANYAPFNWTQSKPGNNTAIIENGGGYAGGYDVAIAQKVADQLGKKLVVVKTDWDGLIPALQSGKIDAIIAGMSPTEERQKEIDFTDSYFDSELVMVVRRDGAYANASTVNDFTNARVTAQLGTLHYDLLEQLTGADIQEAMSDFSAMRVALESGKIDAYVAGKSTAMEIESATSTLKMVQFSPGNGFVVSPEDIATSIGLIKGSDLTERINQILATISQEEREQLMEEAMKGESADAVQETQATQENSGFLADMWKIYTENSQQLYEGAGKTLYISLIGTIIGLIIGLFIGVIRTIPKATTKGKQIIMKVVNALLTVYIEVFRGTPMIVQAMVVYYGSSLLFGVDMDRMLAAFFIVSVNTGAYMSEVVRGGIVAIDKGQFEAAQALGMTHFQTMRHVVLPQVMKNILPATGNEFVINIKDTSVLNVIGVTELFFTTRSIAATNYQFFQTFLVTCIFYFVMTFTVTRILRYAEKKISGESTYQLTSGQMQV